MIKGISLFSYPGDLASLVPELERQGEREREMRHNSESISGFACGLVVYTG